MMQTGFYGRNLAEVAATLVDEAVRDLISRGEGILPDVHEDDARASVYSFDDTSQVKSQEALEIVAPRIVSASEELIARLREAPHDIYTITPRQFEEVIAELLINMGLEIHLTKPTRDGGMDVLAYLPTDVGRLLCLIEAKRYRQNRPVGVEVVRSLYGNLHHIGATSGMVATTSYFSNDAQRFVGKHKYQLSLRDYHDVFGWIRDYGSRLTGQGPGQANKRM